MRKAALALVCALVLLAGCSAITGGDATTTAVGDGTTVETTAATSTTTTATETTTTDATATDAAQEETMNTSGVTDGDATPEPGDTDTAGATSDPNDTADATDTATAGATTTGPNVSAVDDIADPASDRLGWEGGYWYNESLSISTDDGLNASERAAVVNRTMARIERIRQLEFTQSVPVRVISRAEYLQQRGGAGGEPSAALRTFDNAKFEALFMIGEEENSLATQETNLNQSVAGFYSSRNGSIVVVSDSETPRLTRSTLSHELVHALQDQQFGLFSGEGPVTRDGLNARNGAIEGEANYIQRRYEARCAGGDAPAGGGVEWTCRETPSAGGGGGSAGDLHFGVYLLQFFPYSDGPGFVDAIYQERGWEGVNQLHEDLPESTEQVIYPDRYGNDTPTNLSIANASAEGWTRVRPEGRVDYATLGQSGLSSMFGYTAYDQYNRTAIVSQQQLLNVGLSGINTTDPINYGLEVTEGWEGDRMHVYRNDAGETGYVWKLAWDSPAEAEEFVAGYEALLAHWGGEPTESNTWTLAEDSPFADAISIQQNGDTVTIVNAPTVEGLDALRPGSA